jgi:DNA-binding LacI/PurR family transcriptional regulator
LGEVPVSQRPRPPGARTSPTIYDVARAAGVAPSTVSRAFSRPGRVNAETAERIRTVATELGYHANPMARALPTGKTGMIAVAVSDITNPYYSGIIRGAQAAASELGYTTVLTDAQESDRLEREALDRVIPTVEGILLASSRMSDSAIRMTAKQRPLIVLNRDITDVASVVVDLELAARQVIDHLAGLGHSKITYVAGPEASWADGIRWQTLRTLAEEHGIQVRRLGPFSPDIAGGIAAAVELRSRPGSAAIAFNDLMAIGLIRALIAAGAGIPGDLSVVGFDNIFGADLITPGLTTAAAPLRALGSMAVHNLMAMIGGATPTPGGPQLTLPTRLVVRGSTAAVSGRRRVRR